MSNHGHIYRLRFDNVQPTIPLDEAVLWVDEGVLPARILSKRAGSAAFEVTGERYPTEAFTATTTLDDTHRYVTMDAAGGARTVNLPAIATSMGRYYNIKKIDATANKVTINPNLTEPIDGALFRKLYERNESIGIICDGTSWHIVEQTGVPKFYNGTHWLGPEFPIPWTYRPSSFQPYTTSPETIAHYLIPASKTLWAVRLEINTHVVATNDGSNYWDIDLTKAIDGSTIDSITTAGDGADTWMEQPTITTFADNPFAQWSITGFGIVAYKTGSPGGLYPTVELWCREVFI